jgi:hypothetical protein
VVAEPIDPAGATYTGSYTEAFGYQSVPFTTAVHIVAQGSDGSMLRLTFVAHITGTPSGTEISFDREQCG